MAGLDLNWLEPHPVHLKVQTETLKAARTARDSRYKETEREIEEGNVLQRTVKCDYRGAQQKPGEDQHRY